MHESRIDHDADAMVTMSGAVSGACVEDLGAQLQDTLDRAGRDIILDMRDADVFDDAALVTLILAGSRAAFQHRRIVLVDREGGATTTALRRSGLSLGFPIYSDPDAAVDALSAGCCAPRLAPDLPGTST